MDIRRTAAMLGTAGALTLGLTTIAWAAPGDTVYEGSTSEDVPVKLTVGTAGNATAFKIGKTRVTCANGGTLTNRGGTYSGFDTSDPGVFADKRRSSSDNGGYHFKTGSTIEGHINDDQESWSGTFKLVTKVFKNDERIDVCKLKTKWDVA